jgi:type IV secretion system protein TrbL
MSMVEAYVTVGAGYIFLGFGGSRWTLPYTEKYLGMVVAAGVRIMVMELLIGLGSNLYPQWDQMAQKISAIPDLMDGGAVGGQWSGIELEAALVTSIAIYGLLCWMIPRLASNVVQGGLSMSGGDVIASGAAVASTGLAAASLLSGSSQSSSKAVAEVAQAAAMKGAEMGVQLGAAAMTGGASGAVTGASSAASMGGASKIGGAAGMSAMDGFTPPPPSGGTPDAPGGGSGSAGGWSDRTPPPPSSVSDVNNAAGDRSMDTGDMGPIDPSSGVEVAAQEAEAAQVEGEFAASLETSADQSVSTVSEASRDAGAENETKEPASVNPQTPQVPSTETSMNPAKGTEISSSSGGTGQGSTPQAPTGRNGASGVINALKTVVNEAERAINKLPDNSGHVGGTTPKIDHGE